MTKRRRESEIIRFLCDADKRTRFSGARQRAQRTSVAEAIRMGHRVIESEAQRLPTPDGGR